MSTWSIRYVRLGNRAADIARLRVHAGPRAAIHDDGASQFAGWSVEPPSFEPAQLSALARDFGELVSIAVQTVADVVVYDHFVRGKHERGLTYAGDAGWVRVVGDPGPWEAQTFFAPSKLAELNHALEDDFTDDERERERAELERLWSVGRLEQGSTRPATDPLTMARALTKHFALPAQPTTTKPKAR